MGFEPAGDLGFEGIQLAGTHAGFSLAEALAGKPFYDRAGIRGELGGDLIGAQAFVVFEMPDFAKQLVVDHAAPPICLKISLIEQIPAPRSAPS